VELSETEKVKLLNSKSKTIIFLAQNNKGGKIDDVCCENMQEWNKKQRDLESENCR
jgi:hypothetical protein